jgi:glycosyltransferase involved in cell wall biosynthesis
MRVTLVTATPGTTRLGSGTFVATDQLARNLTRAGHSVRIVRPRTDRQTPLSFLASRFAFNFGLSRSTIDANDEVVVGFDMDGWRLAGRISQPFVAYLHGVIADEARFERGTVGFFLRLQARAEALAAQRANQVLATSEYSSRRIAELYQVRPERIAIVRPGIDLASWDDLLSRAPREIREHPTIFSVAHLYPRKNLAALIRAAALLRRDTDFRVRIAGIGPEMSRLEGMTREADLQDIVAFLGHVDMNRLAVEYRSCDVFCLPSLQEGFGLVYVEAMAAGKPVVALNASSTPEIVTDGVHGRLAAPGNDDSLASCLRELLADAPRREQMGRAARSQAERFTAEQMARAFVDAVAPMTKPTGGTTLPSSLTT